MAPALPSPRRRTWPLLLIGGAVVAALGVGGWALLRGGNGPGNAAQSPPFMTAKRVVVVRDYEALPADVVGPVVDVLGDLLDTTHVVFVSGAGGRVPKALETALKSANQRGSGGDKILDVLQAELDQAGLSMKGDAARAVTQHLGDDAGRIGALVDIWAATFGPGARLELDDVTPYLGELGAVKPYELTNRIEDGDVAGALEVLHRLTTVTSPTQPTPITPIAGISELRSAIAPPSSA